MMEDYALFARMLAAGARPVNVAEPLLFYRVGAAAFKRRGGAGLLRSELRLQLEFRRRGSPRRPSSPGMSRCAGATGWSRGGSGGPVPADRGPARRAPQA